GFGFGGFELGFCLGDVLLRINAGLEQDGGEVKGITISVDGVIEELDQSVLAAELEVVGGKFGLGGEFGVFEISGGGLGLGGAGANGITHATPKIGLPRTIKREIVGGDVGIMKRDAAAGVGALAGDAGIGGERGEILRLGFTH